MVKAMLGGRETVELNSLADIEAALGRADGQALSYLAVRSDGSESMRPGFIQATSKPKAEQPWEVEIGFQGDLQKTLMDGAGAALAIARWAGLAEGEPTDGHEWKQITI